MQLPASLYTSIFRTLRRLTRSVCCDLLGISLGIVPAGYRRRRPVQVTEAQVCHAVQRFISFETLVSD